MVQNFLWKSEFQWTKQIAEDIDDTDPEIKTEIKVNALVIEVGVLEKLETSISSWIKLVRVVAWIIKINKILLTRIKKERPNIVGNEHQQGRLTVSLLHEAKKNFIRWHQQQAFSEEIKQLKNTHMQKEKQLKKKSGIYNLYPSLYKEGLLRVGGRLKKSNLHFSEIHPLLIGNKSKTTTLIVEWCHQRTAHGGRGLTMNEVRSNGFCVVKCNTVVRNLVGKCVKCLLLRGRLGEKKMADLRNDRTLDGTTFTNCGVDMFRPFLIKEGRTELKR